MASPCEQLQGPAGSGAGGHRGRRRDRLSIAYHLAHLGWTDIVLLEQHELTAGTTWHAAGLITSAGMTDETALFLSRYSRDLYERLETETGHSTGFNPVGHISLATNPQRLEALRRSSAWMHGFGVTEHEISARELQDMWPLLDTSDVLAGFYVPDEGRADPVGVATSMAKGAKALGAQVIQGVTVRGVETKRGRVTAVDTDRGRIETEVVVNAAGMWARQLGERDGVCIPLQAAEHCYLITDTVPGMTHDLAVIEDPDRYGYYRPRATACWSACSSRWAHRGRWTGAGRFRLRHPAAGLGARRPLPGCRARTHPVAVRSRGEAVLLRPGVLHPGHPSDARAGTRTGRLLRRGRHELAGHPHRRRRRHRAGALDRGRRSAGRRHRVRHRPGRRPRKLAALPL